MGNISVSDGQLDKDAQSDSELGLLTLSLYKHLLDDVDQEGLECTIHGVKYHIVPSMLSQDHPSDPKHQFVSIIRSDGEGGEMAFFLKEEDRALGNPDDALSFLKEACNQLGVSSAVQSVQKGVAGRTGLIAGAQVNTINFF